MQDSAAPGKVAAIVKCNSPEHTSAHPLRGWPSNCDADCEGAVAKVHVVSVPAGVIPFPPAALNYIANHSDLHIVMEEVNAYIVSKAINPEFGRFHMLACSACLKDKPSQWSDTGGLVCCSTCCSSLHFKCTSTGLSEFPETGHGSLWLCPECMDRLESGQLGQPVVTPALMTVVNLDSAMKELRKVADWREADEFPLPSHSLAKLKQADSAYRLKLQQLGLQLPNWLPPLPAPVVPAAVVPAPMPAPAPATVPAPAPAAPAPAAPVPAPASADLERHILEPLWQLRTTLTSPADEAAFDGKAAQLLEAAWHKRTVGGAPAGFAALRGLSTDHSRQQLLTGIRSTAFDFDRAHTQPFVQQLQQVCLPQLAAAAAQPGNPPAGCAGSAWSLYVSFAEVKSKVEPQPGGIAAAQSFQAAAEKLMAALMAVAGGAAAPPLSYQAASAAVAAMFDASTAAPSTAAALGMLLMAGN